MDGTVKSANPQANDDSLITDPMSAPLGSVPAILDRERFEHHLREFLAEYCPCGPTENTLVRDLARQAAVVDRWAAAAEAVERTAARNLPGLASVFPESDNFTADALLSGAMTSDAAYQCERHSLASSRAFCRTLTKLEQVQEKRTSRDGKNLAIPSSFADEAACQTYLEHWLRNGRRPCDNCGSSTGCFLPSRCTWECGKCSKQFGVRYGTVMAGSAIPMLTWTEAIRLLLWQPTISVIDLAEKLGIRRRGTVRTMARRIREAMAADDASIRLAGLNVHFARPADDLNQAHT